MILRPTKRGEHVAEEIVVAAWWGSRFSGGGGGAWVGERGAGSRFQHLHDALDADEQCLLRHPERCAHVLTANG